MILALVVIVAVCFPGLLLWRLSRRERPALTDEEVSVSALCVCSSCSASIEGNGADEFAALGDAETEHFTKTGCRGELVSCGRAGSRVAFVRMGLIRRAEEQSPPWSQIGERPPPPRPMPTKTPGVGMIYQK